MSIRWRVLFFKAALKLGPYDMRRIFERFYRADQSRSGQHVAGAGIGLSLAQKLVTRQSGQLSASSTVGKGSTFTISLPAA